MKKMTKMNEGKSIKTSFGIHHGDEFLTKRHFDEFVDKICHAISLWNSSYATQERGELSN